MNPELPSRTLTFPPPSQAIDIETASGTRRLCSAEKAAAIEINVVCRSPITARLEHSTGFESIGRWCWSALLGSDTIVQ
jgi:hypothetical protein